MSVQGLYHHEHFILFTFVVIVFVSPEVALSSSFDTIFSLPFVKRNLVLVAIDEAHCITDWYIATHVFCKSFVIIQRYVCFRGADFRPSFDKLGRLRAVIKCPFMALTATASQSTYDSIVESLHLDQQVTVSRSLNRPNIYFSVSELKSLKVSK